jgi:hypothetical protein
MNLKEGTRRLALLLGVVGAGLGAFAAYLELQTALAQRTRHDKFEQLAMVDVVQRQRKFLQKSPEVISGPYPMTAKQFGQKFKAAFPEYGDIGDEALAKKVLAKYPQYRDTVVPWELSWEQAHPPTEDSPSGNSDPWKKAENDVGGMEAWQAGEPFKVERNEIKNVWWTSGFAVSIS